jgi:hypothetical protein
MGFFKAESLDVGGVSDTDFHHGEFLSADDIDPVGLKIVLQFRNVDHVEVED